MTLYKEELLDHFKNPRNLGTLKNPEIDSLEDNPTCGDSVQIQATVKNNRLQKIVFTGKGCVISQAAASMLTQACIEKSLEEILLLDAQFVLDLLGIYLGPNRLRCAILSLNALQKGIKQYLSSKER